MSKEDHSLFFVSIVSRGRALLTKEEYRHARLVLRMGENAFIHGTDGRGNIYKCRLSERSDENGGIDIIETFPQKAPKSAVRFFIGLPDRGAFEEAVVGLSAVGASSILPLICDYCQKPWWNPWDKHIERLRRKMISGIKQAHNPWLPELGQPQRLSEAIQTAREKNATCLVADAGGETISSVLSGNTTPEQIFCFIGPPGGFSPEEKSLFDVEGYTKMTLGRYRLRTELAAIVLCVILLSQ